jgi:peptidoglycan/xylan/chitin deacetylase (PgdA/CDA1 family)
MTRTDIAGEIHRAQKVFTDILGYRAISFASPGWQCTPPALAALVAEHFYYLSNTRGYAPYFPGTGEQAWPILEIPTTLPTLDELLGLDGRTAADFNREILAALDNPGTQVLTVHAEMEGRVCLREFTQLLEAMQSREIEFIRLVDYAQELWQQPDSIGRAVMAPGVLPGRGGTVTCQSRGED